MNEEQTKLIKKILKSTRRAIRAQAIQVGHERCDGFCMDAASLLCSKLEDAGFLPQIAEAKVFDDTTIPATGKINPHWQWHAFVILEDYVLDVTADQFIYDIQKRRRHPQVVMKRFCDLKPLEKRWWWGFPPVGYQFQLYIKHRYKSIGDFMRGQ